MNIVEYENLREITIKIKVKQVKQIDQADSIIFSNSKIFPEFIIKLISIP